MSTTRLEEKSFNGIILAIGEQRKRKRGKDEDPNMEKM